MSNINDFVIENGVLKEYRGSDAEVIIPDGVTTIGRMAFSRSTCSKIVLPESVTTIGDSAFSNCLNLADFEVPAGVTVLGGAVFNGCSGLCSISIPVGVTSINDWTFAGCSALKKIEFPAGLLSIGQKAFLNCSSLEEIVVPNGVVSIGELAFAGCSNLTRVSIPDTLISVGGERGAFFDCKNLKYNEYDNAYYLGNEVNGFAVLISAKDSDISKCEIHEDTKLIGTPAFNACTNLENISIPNGVISIGDNAFNGCVKIDHIDIPGTVVYIGNYAFYYCIKLNNVIIPNNVKTIGDSCFGNCYGLMSVTIGAGVENVGKKAFPSQTQYVLAEGYCRNKSILPQFIPYIVCNNSMDFAYLWVNQSGKKWDDWFLAQQFDVEEVLSCIVELSLHKDEITKKDIKRVSDYIAKFNASTGDDALRALSSKA